MDPVSENIAFFYILPLLWQCFLYFSFFYSVCTKGSPPPCGSGRAPRPHFPWMGLCLPTLPLSAQGGSSNIPEDAVTVDTAPGSLSKLVTFHGDKLTGASSFTIRLFGLIPFKEMKVQVMQDQELIPVGVPIGIYVKTDGLLVVGTGSFPDEGGNEVSPARSLLHSGDYILAINGTAVQDKETFMELVNESKRNTVTLTVKRNENLLFLAITPKKAQSGDYKLGIWVRDNAQGIGTMTYLDADGNFGALGHGINDVDTSALMTSHDGTIYETQILSIKKGKAALPEK